MSIVTAQHLIFQRIVLQANSQDTRRQPVFSLHLFGYKLDGVGDSIGGSLLGGGKK